MPTPFQSRVLTLILLDSLTIVALLVSTGKDSHGGGSFDLGCDGVVGA